MQNISNEILFALSVGIVASLISVFLSLMFREYWLKIIMPWYEERLYQGAKIEGQWRTITEYKDGGKNESIYTIKRKGHRIEGVIYSPNGIDKGKSWSFHGRFKDLILTATYESSSPRILDKGSFSLMLKHNGEKLTGHLIYYANDGNQMKTTTLELYPMLNEELKPNTALQPTAKRGG